ncbi:smoothened homolog [Paramacrobiotus metropolitanus]|uniref:smoothened homolog n=1 Tax=Paramacrobiotus metropolitanus TaxID=2943436 RepID=UPI00244562EF|nr:smoothened homolog [Paramacrobiotus metropolitanus]
MLLYWNIRRRFIFCVIPLMLKFAFANGTGRGEKSLISKRERAKNTSSSFVFNNNDLRDDDVPQWQRINETKIPKIPNRLQTYLVLDRPRECTKFVQMCVPIPRNVTEYLSSINVRLRYDSTTESNDWEVLEFIEKAQRLKYHSRCWDYVQPLIFAVAIPKCIQRQKRLIPRKECQEIHQMCGDKVMRALPESLSPLKTCQDDNVFTNNINCEEQVEWFEMLESNITFTCPHPMTATNDTIKITQDDWNTNGNCAVRCHNPFLSESMQQSLHVYIAVLVVMGFIFNGTAFISLALRWRKLTKYPDTCLLFINICFIMAGIGWAIQFIPGARDKITCSEDQTERSHEPKYLISIGHISFRTVYTNEMKASGILRNYSLRFHVAAWVTPLLLCLIVIATSGIDGNHISGICFIGLEWGFVRGFLLVLPLMLVAITSGFFMIRGLMVLYRIKKSKNETLSADDKKNIRSTMLHIGAIAVLVCICILISIFIHAHYYINAAYYTSLRANFINCHLHNLIAGNNDAATVCTQAQSLDFETVELGVHLALQFVAGIIFSSWVWRKNQITKWAKTVKRRMTTKRVDGTSQRSSTISVRPLEQTANRDNRAGVDNVTFVPDTPVVPASPRIEIILASPDGSNSPVVIYGRVVDAVDSIQPSDSATSPGYNSLPGTPVPVSPTAMEVEIEDRLQNWQERAREVRLEKRKISATKPPTSIQQLPVKRDSLQFLPSTPLPDNTVIVKMDPNGSSASRLKQRRLGRVEHFKQGQLPKHLMQRMISAENSDTSQSVEMSELSSSSSNNLVQPPVPIKSILKNAKNQEETDDKRRESPDEGIDIGRPETGSRESVLSAEPEFDSDDRIHFRRGTIDASDA